MVSKKIAMLGMWGVGKTSLVQQYVHTLYSEKYHASLGVKVDKKTVERSDGQQMMLMLWDIAGAEDHFSVPLSYVRGSAGYLLVMDGTRPETIDCALELVETVESGIGRLPFVAVINKSDLDWKVTAKDVRSRFADQAVQVLPSSARTGENVEAAFLALAEQL